MGWNLGKDEKLENEYDKLTQKKETVTTDTQHTILETDNYKDIFGKSNIGEISNSNNKHLTDIEKNH